MTIKLSKIAKFGAFSALVFLMSAHTILGADFRTPNDKQDKNIIVAETEVIRNLYTVGGQVTVNANAIKDVVVAGGTVNVNGNVGDDLIAASGNLNVRGNIGGSARLAGGNISVANKSIEEDLLVAGGTIYIDKGTTIHGDLIVGGGSVVVDGTVLGSVKASGGSLTLNGSVGGKRRKVTI